MKITVTVKKEVEVATLKVIAQVRYWEDGTLNGETDDEGKMPCRVGDCWQPIIDLQTGKITNWHMGNTADIHYKVCDAGSYTLLDDEGNDVITIDGYVPSIICPKDKGYGDYIIMSIDENGVIDGFDGSNLLSFEDNG